MNNELANMLSKSSSQMNNISNVLSMIKGIKNPTEMLANIVKTNPQANMLLKTIKDGGDPKTMFYEMAKQKGVNADEILEMAKSLSGNNS